MDYDEKSNQPTFDLLLGVVGRSLAIKTARKVGVSELVLERALTILGPEAKMHDNKLKELETTKGELEDVKSRYSRLMHEVQEKKNLYSQLIDKFKKERESWLKKSVQIAEKRLDALYEEFKSEQIKTKPLSEWKSKLPHIVRVPTARVIENSEEFSKAYPPGSSIFAKSLGQDAIVQGIPNSKGDVPILSNSMRLLVHWSDLGHPRTPQNPTVPLARKGGVLNANTFQDDREVDLRGHRVEEALELLELELDTAIKNQEERVKIIHGHGTEALKKAVRAYFSRSAYVKKWIAGDPHSGGDGITWVELAD